MDLDAFFAAELDEHEQVTRATRAALPAAFARLVTVAAVALERGNKIVFFGNGGSAADAQHLAAELVVRYRVDRAPLAALALTTDSSVLTAGGNDLGYDQIFARQVRALCRLGDVAIGISTSGRSPNVIEGLRAALEMGAIAAALAGGDGGRLVGLADPLLIVPSTTTARIQEMHILLGQMLCGALETMAVAAEHAR
ncbi:MAG: SIS domain-containing protein [Alphaproteobacteria bacterium]|nr:SIS domain-containing protein [Alphaproteobacteria bacterium]